MISTSKNYIEAFLKTCFEEGVHEKQAAVFLKYAQEEELKREKKKKSEEEDVGFWNKLTRRRR